MFGTVEPLFQKTLLAGDVAIFPPIERSDIIAEERALMWRATAVAIEGAFRFGQDLPDGAAALSGGKVSAAIYASDMRTRHENLHAETYTLIRAKHNDLTDPPEAIAVTFEPCGSCQGTLNHDNTLRRVLFSLDRKAVSDRGLINERPGILDGQEITDKPYYLQLTDPNIALINGILLDSTSRNTSTGETSVDTGKLFDELTSIDFIVPARV